MFGLGEKLLYSTFREESFRRVTAALTEKGIPFRGKIVTSGSTVQYSGSASTIGEHQSMDADYRIFVKNKDFGEAEYILRRSK